MALRGWRFFGVAGTIIAYVAGILILSIVSLNSPNPRRARAGRFVDFDNINKQQRESSLLGKRQPLQWCTELKFINIIDGNSLERSHNNKTNNNDRRTAIFLSSQLQKQLNSKNQHQRPITTNNELLRPTTTITDKPIKVIPFNSNNKRYILRNAYEKFDDKYMDNDKNHQELQQQQQQQQMDIKLNAEKIYANVAGRHIDENHKSILLDQQQQNDIWKKRIRLLELEKQQTIIDRNKRKLIALASFPGSGNTWLRYLLQQATGIHTGSVYKDFGLLKSGFPGEHIFNSSVLVIKTHEWGPQAWGNFSKAILLIRDPDKSILAEFNRQSGGHVGFASPDRYKRTKGRYWQQFVTNKLWAWEQMNMQWAKNFTGDILIVYYDDLIENVEVHLRKILDFINYPINEELLSCALLRKEGIYRRKRRIMNFDPYTQEMHRILDEKRNEVYTALGRF